MSEDRKLGCMTCGKRKSHPDGFPDAMSVSTCWQCWAIDHLAHQHKGLVRTIRKKAKKAARRVPTDDVSLLRHVYGDDRLVLELLSGAKDRPSLPTTPTPPTTAPREDTPS